MSLQEAHPQVEVYRLLNEIDQIDGQLARQDQHLRRRWSVRGYVERVATLATRWAVQQTLDTQLTRLALTAA
ncbi:MAG: hypothetical protein AB8I08_28620 [Sandaracinaceae bacterium]